MGYTPQDYTKFIISVRLNQVDFQLNTALFFDILDRRSCSSL